MIPMYPGNSGLCGICRTIVGIGQSQAFFTTSCSHSFHFGCFSRQGNPNYCPVCLFDLSRNNLPLRSLPLFTPPIPSHSQPLEPLEFSDDDPLPAVTPDGNSSASPGGLQNICIKTIPERPAIAASQSVSEFSVVVGIKAPSLSDDTPLSQRAPVDLVAFLDVSGSMQGTKLQLVKRAVHFVIDNLGSFDRLSIVSFSTQAKRVLRLTRMSENGCGEVKQAVNSLQVEGSTNIVEGLKKRVRILEETTESSCDNFVLVRRKR